MLFFCKIFVIIKALFFLKLTTALFKKNLKQILNLVFLPAGALARLRKPLLGRGAVVYTNHLCALARPKNWPSLGKTSPYSLLATPLLAQKSCESSLRI
jgi:hypothetical protein